MIQRRVSFTLTFLIFALVGLRANPAYPVELFTIGPNPSTGGNPPNVSINGSNVCVGIIVTETSGSADTIDISYWAFDQNTGNVLTCNPSSDGPFPITKGTGTTHQVKDSCTIVAPPGTVGPIQFEAQVNGVTFGGLQTYYQTIALNKRPIPHKFKVPHTFWAPTVAFNALKDYTVPVTVSVDPGVGVKVKMTYTATIKDASGTRAVPCTPAFETVNVSSTIPVTHQVQIHCYGVSGDLTFTASASGAGLATSVQQTYTVPNIVEQSCSPVLTTADKHTADDAYEADSKTAEREQSKSEKKKSHKTKATNTTSSSVSQSLTLQAGTISPTDQYVAAVTFPVVTDETRVQAFYSAQDPSKNALDVSPSISKLRLQPGTLQTKNVIIDCSGLVGKCLNFHVGGVAGQFGNFTQDSGFVPQQQ